MAAQSLPETIRSIVNQLSRSDRRSDQTNVCARTSSRIRQVAVSSTLILWWTVVPALAQNATESCNTGTLDPLVSLLNTINQLLFALGISLGGIGFVIAGLLFVVPGQKYNRLAQTVAKNVFIGLLLILSSDMIINFLTGQLGGIC